MRTFHEIWRSLGKCPDNIYCLGECSNTCYKMAEKAVAAARKEDFFRTIPFVPTEADPVAAEKTIEIRLTLKKDSVTRNIMSKILNIKGVTGIIDLDFEVRKPITNQALDVVHTLNHAIEHMRTAIKEAEGHIRSVEDKISKPEE